MTDTASTSSVASSTDKHSQPLIPKDETAKPRRRSLGQRLFDALVDIVATFVAAVLNHPSVQHAVARGIVAGMKAFALEPDLGEHLRVMGETMTKTQTELARNAGEDFPKVVGNFFKGMIQPRSRANSTKDEHLTKQLHQQPQNHLTPPNRPEKQAPSLPMEPASSEMTDDDGSVNCIRIPALAAPLSPVR